MEKGLTIFLAMLVFLLSADVSASEKYELSLKDAITFTIQKNLDVKIVKYQSEISRADINVEKGAFDPELNLSYSEEYKENKASTQLDGAPIPEYGDRNASLSLKQKLHTGTNYELKWIANRNTTNSLFVTDSPYYVSDLVLELRQPLLKGLGKDIQEAKINIAENNYSIELFNLANELEIAKTQVEKLYWDLVHAHEELEVATLSLDLAKKLYEVTKAKIDAGILAPAEILQPEAEIALREEGLLDNEKMIRDIEDQLKAAMDYQDWNQELIPIDRPQSPTERPLLDKEVMEALKQRYDYMQATIQRKNREIAVHFSKNQTLPDLSLIASAGINGLNDNSSETIDDQFSGDYYSWKAGIVFNMPLGNRIAKSDLRKAEMLKERAIEEENKIKQTIILEVREVVRSVYLALKQIDATAKTEALTKKRLEHEEEKFRSEMSTAQDVLTFQEAFAKALSQKKKAVIDYSKALADLRLIKLVSKKSW